MRNCSGRRDQCRWKSPNGYYRSSHYRLGMNISHLGRQAGHGNTWGSLINLCAPRVVSLDHHLVGPIRQFRASNDVIKLH